MARPWLVLVGIAALGCKDPGPPQQPAPSGAAAPATGSAAAPSAPATPRLEQEPTGSEDTPDDPAARDWAINTERAIKAAVPELTDVACKDLQCQATLSAASEAELVTRAEKLSNEDSLRGIEGARSVLLSAPTIVDGKASMQIVVQYER